MYDSEIAVRSGEPQLEFEGELSVPSAPGQRQTAVKSIFLVVLCTAIGAAAQILMRYGAAHLPDQLHGSMLSDLLSNWALLAGYACLALNTGLLVLALRDGELSVLYPIIALTYVWVTILSPMFFGDHVNAYKLAGVALIVLGVSFIGIGSRS